MQRIAKSVAIVVVAGGAMVFGASGARANLILDPGFESPVITFNWYENYGTYNGDSQYGGASFDPNWVITSNNVDIVSSLTAGGNAPAIEGTQYLDLVGRGTTGGVQQTFATVIGASYQLSFAYGNNPWSTNTASASVTVYDTSGNILLDYVTHNTSTTTNLDWLSYSNTFIATSATTTLSFATTVGSNSGGILLDAVDVSGPSGNATTPLPAAWLTMMSGLAGMGLVARRRRKAGEKATAA